ncbi:MAG: hypothetical protein KAR42_17945 [candidate division Zixibacteria bacterium]|nr:hypothetical protein [candidate division Zixibacteria bacterium]
MIETIIFTIGLTIGFLIGWQSAIDILKTRVIKAIRLTHEAGYFNEDLIDPEKLEKIFQEAKSA